MKHTISVATRLAAIITAGLTLSTTVLAEGDAAAGQAKAAVCAACHGLDGNSVNPVWPSLAGQHASYIVKTVNAFKNGDRSDPLMTAQANLLSQEDLEDVAAYFSAQKGAQRTANPALAKAGERLYRGGDKEEGIAACIACHGPNGRGIAPAGYPALAGQHAPYTAKQLKDFRSGARTSDGDTQVMRNIAEELSDAQIDAVAAYIQGLR